MGVEKYKEQNVFCLYILWYVFRYEQSVALEEIFAKLVHFMRSIVTSDIINIINLLNNILLLYKYNIIINNIIK